jgi:pSer/pThr/pTyr-binding forkhead associated (FHA) protein
MNARLVVEQGSQSTPYHLHAGETVVGRQKGCGLRIPSAEVSRQHCRLLVEEDVIYIEDLDSANGTLLNGEAVESRQLVRPGDRIQVGPVIFIVEYEMTQDVIDRLRDGTRGKKKSKPSRRPAAPPAVPPHTPPAPEEVTPAEERTPYHQDDIHIPLDASLRDLLSGLEDGAEE